MTLTGTVAWFDLAKQFGFVALSNGHGDAFLHMSVLKEAGYVWLPRGTAVQVRIEASSGLPRFWRLTPARHDPGRTSRSCASLRPELKSGLSEYDVAATLIEFSKVKNRMRNCLGVYAYLDLLIIGRYIVVITGMVDPGVGD